MPRKFMCLYPCEKSFDDEASLRKHYQLVPACRWRWKQRERQATEEFERASERRRAEMRRNYAVGDGEILDHAGWEVVSNDADNTSHPEGQSDNGPGSTSPLDHILTSDGHDLAAIADFEECLYGPTQGDVTTEGNDDPYLDASDAIDIDEGPSDYFHASDDVEQLGDILEGVQLGREGAEDEELDPSSGILISPKYLAFKCSCFTSHTMAKAPYRATNRRDHFIQMCAYMNRQAWVALVEEFGTWVFERMQTQVAARDVPETPDYLAFIRRMADVAKKDERLEVRNKSRAGNGFSWLTVKPDKSRVPVDTLLQDYNLRAPSFISKVEIAS